MKVLIEKYRGFDIEFDLDYNQFSSIITDGLEKESKSFPAVRKFIDEYHKETFKPFWIVPKIGGYGNRQKIVGIRKDGRFIVQKGDSQSQLSDYQLSNFRIEDPKDVERYNEYGKISKELDDIRKQLQATGKRLEQEMVGQCLEEFQKGITNGNPNL